MSLFAKNVMKILNKFFSTRLELNYKQLVKNLNYKCRYLFMPGNQMYLEPINKMDSPPRARGALHLTAAGQSKIKNLFQQGSTRALFPRRANGLECIIINTSGGLTGGDEFSNSIS